MIKFNFRTILFLSFLIPIMGMMGIVLFETLPQGEEGSLTVTTLGATKSGTLNFGIYWDKFRTNPVDNIDWGELEPGETKHKTLYVANFELRSIYITGIFSNNSIPVEFADFHNVTIQLVEIGSYRVVPFNITLSISPTIHSIESFKFDTIIYLSDT